MIYNTNNAKKINNKNKIDETQKININIQCKQK